MSRVLGAVPQQAEDPRRQAPERSLFHQQRPLERWCKEYDRKVGFMRLCVRLYVRGNRVNQINKVYLSGKGLKLIKSSS